ncbi:hypothetical protein [Okeania sp.]|uniref:hypothetical protein n=1 Tax=Okeania sp. TaxID=3100323 RepID=UPI002B4B8AC2|nr:hypothetical protein [Okeania sp.]MEB3341086.1 hypothetical protein [Okeania sp.]
MEIKLILLDTNAYDIWIPATGLQHDLALFSYDKNFQNVDGLTSGTCRYDLIVK